MIALDILVTAVGCCAAYLVYVVSEQALRNSSLFASRKAIAFAVSMLTLLAIVALGKAVVFLLLIPFAALGVALVVFSLIHHLGVIKNLETRRAVQSSCEALRKSARDFVRSIQKVVSDLWPK